MKIFFIPRGKTLSNVFGCWKPKKVYAFVKEKQKKSLYLFLLDQIISTEVKKKIL